jgi:hypothetical protein
MESDLVIPASLRVLHVPMIDGGVYRFRFSGRRRWRVTRSYRYGTHPWQADDADSPRAKGEAHLGMGFANAASFYAAEPMLLTVNLAEYANELSSCLSPLVYGERGRSDLDAFKASAETFARITGTAPEIPGRNAKTLEAAKRRLISAIYAVASANGIDADASKVIRR